MNSKTSATVTEPATGSAAQRMRAIVRDRYGPAEALELREVAVPEVAAGEVLVRVHAAGLDRGAWHIMAGLPYLLRVAGYGLRAPKSAGLGSELAGIVETAGADVTALHPGQAVYGTGRAAFAEYTPADSDALAAMPATLTYEQAAAVPVSGVTALQALRNRGRLEAGQHVLVIGASGGVGSYAVQIAKALEATVTGVCSTAKVDLGRPRHAAHADRDGHGDARRRPGRRARRGPRGDPRPHGRTRAGQARRDDLRSRLFAAFGGAARAFRVMLRDRVADLLRDPLEMRVRVIACRRPGRAQGAQTDEFSQRLYVDEVAAAARAQVGRRAAPHAGVAPGALGVGH
jgi:hypothetical protein